MQEGNELLYQYCNDKCISHSPIGKMIIGDKNSEEYLEHLIHTSRKENNVKGLDFLMRKPLINMNQILMQNLQSYQILLGL